MKLKISGPWPKTFGTVRLALFFVCLSPALVLAGRYTVSAGESIRTVLNTLQPGDTLLVRAGTYAESLNFTADGLPGQPIVLMAYPGEKPLISSSKQLVSLNRSYWVIDGLTFDQKNAAVDAISIGSRASFNIIRRCEIRNGQKDGIDISGGASDNTIEGNVIHDFFRSGADAHGIVTDPGVLRLRVLNNTIYNCGGDCIQLYAVNSDPVSSYSRDIEIRGNALYTTFGPNSENALDFKGVDGCIVAENELHGFEDKAFVVQKGCRNLMIERNIIRDSERAMEFRGEGGHSQKNIVVRKNLIYNISDFYAVKFDWVDSVQFYNNTLAFITPAAIRVEEEGVTNGVFRNNLFYQCGSPRISGTFEARFDHNGWFGTDAGAMAGSNDRTGSDPGFAAAASFDFSLAAGSLVIDAGTDVGLDFAGGAPDLGALEFGEKPTAVHLFGFQAESRDRAVRLSWEAAGSVPYNFWIERSRDNVVFAPIGFVRAAALGPQGNYTFEDTNIQPGHYYYRLVRESPGGEKVIGGSVEVFVTGPSTYLLVQSWPNPFSLSRNATAYFAISLSQNDRAQVSIYNLLGQRVRRLYNGMLLSGRHLIPWDGRMETGRLAAPGVYFVKVHTPAGERSQSFIAVR